MNKLITHLFILTCGVINVYSLPETCPIIDLKTPLKQSLDSFCDELEQLQKQEKLNGVLIIASSNNLLCVNTPKTENNALDLSSQFYIGSNTKTFTAVALLKCLHDRFKDITCDADLSNEVSKALHQTLNHYLPEHHPIWNGQMPSWAKEITLHHLLKHTSGIPNFTDLPLFTEKINEFQLYYEIPHTPAEIIETIKDLPLLFNPGENESYSNTGYNLLAEVIETISGMSYEDYLKKIIFDPLKMDSTFSPQSGTHNQLKQDQRFQLLVNDYKYNPKDADKEIYRPSSHIDISHAKGTGSIISTPEDLLKWLRGLTSMHILPSDLYTLLLENEYGLGSDPINGATIYGHKGRLDSFNSSIFFIPKEDLFIIMLSNVEYDWDLLNSEYKTLKSSLKQEEHSTLKEEELNEIIINKILEQYPDDRGHGHLDDLLFQKLQILEN